MKKVDRYSKSFLDTIRLLVRGGCGGMGLPKYHGVGGRGGSVYLEAAKGITLKNVLRKYSLKKVVAESGNDSKTMQIYATSGSDKVVKVPVGVVIYDEYMRKIGELNEPGDKVLVAEGGPGGSPTSKPAYSGSKGHSQVITVDLKVLADVGLVGFPNAGKSTLLKAVSACKPKIAEYAFTTLKPNVGIMEYPDFRQISMADLPGLVEGASQNIGMGHKFLKHVERSSLLLMVIDVQGFQLTPDSSYRNCVETAIILNKELELYNKTLLDKPAVLAINKMDLPGGPSTYKELFPFLNDLPAYASRLPEELRPEKFLKFDCVVPISAKEDPESVEKLKNILRESLDKHFELSLKEEMTEKEFKLLEKARREFKEITKVYL